MKTTKLTNEENFRCLEDLQETSSELTLVHFGWEKCKPYHVYAGARDEYIIHCILSGHGFYSASSNTWTLSAGQMFLARPGKPITYCADSRDPWTYAWFGFKGERVTTLLSQCGFSKTRLVLPSPDPAAFLAIIDDMFAHVSLSSADSLYREASLFRLFSLLTENGARLPALTSQDSENDKTNTYVLQAIDYINSAYMHGITVTDIAEQIGISRAYLNRLFKNEYSLSCQEFLMDFRMHKAAKLLVNTDLPVKEVSQNTGYRDPLVFSKAFKKRFDLSPQNFRLTKQELEFRDERPEQKWE